MARGNTVNALCRPALRRHGWCVSVWSHSFTCPQTSAGWESEFPNSWDALSEHLPGHGRSIQTAQGRVQRRPGLLEVSWSGQLLVLGGTAATLGTWETSFPVSSFPVSESRGSRTFLLYSGRFGNWSIRRQSPRMG